MKTILETLKRKWVEYLLEVIVITVGILGAFMLNNWNGNRLERITEQRYLISFKNDIKKQLKSLENANRHFSNTAQIAESILSDYQLKGSLTNVDSLDHKITRLIITFDFPNINTTFTEISSSGQIGFILNNNLRTQLIELYQNNDSFETTINDNLNNVFYPHIFSDFKSAIFMDLKDFG